MNQIMESFDQRMFTFQIASEADLMKTFAIEDQKHVVLPQKLKYPILTQHYFKWSEPSGVYSYLVFKKPNWDSPVGMIFKKTSKSSLFPQKRMCDWCHSYGPSDQIGMMTTKANSRTTVGMLLCLDLSCIDKLDEFASLAGKNFEKMASDLCNRIGRFYEMTLLDEKSSDGQ